MQSHSDRRTSAPGKPPLAAEGSRPCRIALAGDVALDLMAPYFRKAGYEVYVPAGFAAWRQEMLDRSSGLNAFAPSAVVDVTAFDEALSREVPSFYDERMRTLASMPYSLAGIEAIVEETAFSLMSAPKKILAVDADNTLWKGILSEDGKDALEPFADFQKGLLRLREKGVVLVLLTKNDPAGRFMRPDMPIGDDAFAVRMINWKPKAGNLIEACRSLNLSPDSAVFVDDNPFERAQMAQHLPDVTVVPFPRDMASPAQFLRRLETYFFADMGQTEEDRLRAADYASRRKVSAGDFADAGEYLKALELRVSPSLACEGDVPRLEQMALKTNQFNAMTIRRKADGFRALLADPDKRVYVFRTRDRFAEQGIVCYIVVDMPSCRIVDFVMSCRAMGRTLEYFAYGHVADAVGFDPEIDFAPTAKNAPFKAFLDGPLRQETFYGLSNQKGDE